jgi:type 1 fimbria pilin
MMPAFPGAGLRVTLGNRVVSNRDRIDSDPDRSITTINSRSGYTGTITLNNQLLKWGDLEIPPYGRIDFGVVYALHSYDNTTRTTSAPLAFVSINNGLPPRPTCTVTTTNITVPLPTVAAARLRTEGTSAGRTAFSIGLNCVRSDAGVYITVTDATTPGNRTDLLTLTQNATAGGIGIRIRNPSDMPVYFGPDSADAGTVNQWRVGPARTTTAIRMTAEYVSTGDTTPGFVEALATFTMSYR